MGTNIVDLTRACYAHMGEKYKHIGQERVSTIRAVFEEFKAGNQPQMHIFNLIFFPSFFKKHDSTQCQVLWYACSESSCE